MAIEDLELGEPREREVCVKLTASGVCHSDLHYMKGDREHPMPVVLGHEGADSGVGGAWSWLRSAGRPRSTIFRTDLRPVLLLRERPPEPLRGPLINSKVGCWMAAHACVTGLKKYTISTVYPPLASTQLFQKIVS
ncbi:MAG: hypothetical protein Ct9H300mP11_22020 [Chloroflexota bacterium]|nr:MAG: hypothetical protein Ct9H300mP11_22020 [Chloroflexota bacterium]